MRECEKECEGAAAARVFNLLSQAVTCMYMYTSCELPLAPRQHTNKHQARAYSSPSLTSCTFVSSSCTRCLAAASSSHTWPLSCPTNSSTSTTA